MEYDIVDYSSIRERILQYVFASYYIKLAISIAFYLYFYFCKIMLTRYGFDSILNSNILIRSSKDGDKNT